MRDQDIRTALLDAARVLFARRGFNEVGIREIAEAAGATPAMIHYYFSDKEGLYRAMLTEAAERLVERVRDLVQSPTDGNPIEALLRLYVATLAADPWIPRLVIREVLSDDAPLRELFIQRFASQVAMLVPGLIKQEIARGHLRSDLDPALSTLSLVGMTAFPFAAAPVARRVLGIEMNEEFIKRFATHTARLFLQGVRAEGGER